jgi:hypothetical protein
MKTNMRNFLFGSVFIGLLINAVPAHADLEACCTAATVCAGHGHCKGGCPAGSSEENGTTPSGYEFSTCHFGAIMKKDPIGIKTPREPSGGTNYGPATKPKVQ